jgi:hypothetical protein
VTSGSHLILTADFGQPGTRSDAVIWHFLLELGILTLLIVAIAVSLFALRCRDTASVAKRG